MTSDWNIKKRKIERPKKEDQGDDNKENKGKVFPLAEAQETKLQELKVQLNEKSLNLEATRDEAALEDNADSVPKKWLEKANTCVATTAQWKLKVEEVLAKKESNEKFTALTKGIKDACKEADSMVSKLQSFISED
eukprot:10092901-Karenia_brevis.AAC.1